MWKKIKKSTIGGGHLIEFVFHLQWGNSNDVILFATNGVNFKYFFLHQRWVTSNDFFLSPMGVHFKWFKKFFKGFISSLL
jgi:hypothetical protein